MNSAIETCPTLEDLATFLDGKLAGKERSRVVSHLADCESCYAVFADAARLQLEDEEQGASVVPFPRDRFPRWAWPIAAMLALSTAAIPLYLSYNRTPVIMSATILVGPFDVLSEEDLRDRLWLPVTRSGDKRGATVDAPAEFLVGAHLVDLRLALKQNDKEVSLDVLSFINAHMKSIGFVQEEAKSFLELHARVNNDRPPRELLRQAEDTEARLTERLSVPPYFSFLAFGKWTEAGRLYAQAGNPEFFDNRENRRLPGWLIRKAEDEALDGEVVASLGEIRDLIDKSNSPAYPYPVLADKFKDILDHYQTEADVQSEGFESSP